jgi:hypothetical protein
VSDPLNNGNGTGPSLPDVGERYSPEDVSDILDTLMDAMEALSEQVAAPQMTFTEEQRARLGNLFLVRYAIQSGVPPAIALIINGFDVPVEEAAAPPAPELDATDDDDASGQQGPDDAVRLLRIEQQVDRMQHEQRQTELAARLAHLEDAMRSTSQDDDEDRAVLREAIALMRSTLAPDEGDGNAHDTDDDAPTHSDDTAAEPAADDETESVLEANGNTADTGAERSQPSPDPTRHRTRGRAVRDERTDAGGAGDEGEPAEPVQ